MRRRCPRGADGDSRLPGKRPDTQFSSLGYGGVDYTYQIGAFEVTGGEYTKFLNPVAA